MSWYKNIQLPNNFFWGVGVVALVSLLVWMSKKLYESSRTDPKSLKKAATLVHDASKSLMTSQQTNSPILAFANATEANAYLNVAFHLAKESELEKTTKIKVHDLALDIEQQERVTREKLLQLCPQVGSPGKAALAAAQVGFHNPAGSMFPPNMMSGMPIPAGRAPPPVTQFFQ